MMILVRANSRRKCVKRKERNRCLVHLLLAVQSTVLHDGKKGANFFCSCYLAYFDEKPFRFLLMKLQSLFLALFFRRLKYDFDDSFLIPLTRVHILTLNQTTVL